MAPSEGLGGFAGMTERKKAGVRRTLPPLLPPLLFHSVLRRQTAEVRKGKQKWSKSARVRKKREARLGGFLIALQGWYILPSRCTLHPSPPSPCSPHFSVFYSVLSAPDGSDCLPLQPHFSTTVPLFSSSQISLFLILPPTSLVHDTPTDFVTLGFLARRENQAESQIQRAKK